MPLNNPISNPITLLLLILCVALAIKHVIFLFGRKAEKDIANKILGVLAFIFLLFFLPAVLYRFDILDHFPHLIGVHSFVLFLIGPLTYFYVRSCTQEDFEMKPVLWIHFIPFIIDVFIGLPFLFQSGQEKLEFYYLFLVEGQLRGDEIVLISKVVHGLIYFGLSLQLVQHYRKYLPTTASYVDKIYHRWLAFFIVIISFPILALVVFYLTQFSLDYSKIVVVASGTVFLVVIDIAITYKPEIFQKFPQQMLSTESLKKKYENSNLDEAQKERYVLKLQDYVKHHEPYKEPELTLGILSERLDIPTHYLSQVINEKLGTNFLEYINRHRTEYAKSLLVDPDMSHYTIMSIAYDSGFNSKSTFYTAFKKYTGQTPSQFKKQHKSIT